MVETFDNKIGQQSGQQNRTISNYITDVFRRNYLTNDGIL